MTKTIFTYFSLLLCLVVNGQSNDRFTGYGVNEGLAQSSIDELIQDKYGFLWVGTAGGLSRFDGYQFTTYKQSVTDSKAVSSDRGFHFYIDRNERLWIVSYNGISVYNEQADNFTNLLVYTPKNVITIENHFYGEDDTYIWIGLCNYGILKVNKKTLQVHNTAFSQRALRPGIIAWYHGFIEKGKLWVVENNESSKPMFVLFDTKTEKKDTVPILLNDIINLNDVEAFGFNNKTGFLVNKKDLSYKTIDLTLPNGTERNIINMHRESDHEVLLCSSTQGLYYLDTKTWIIAKHISLTNPENKKAVLLARTAYRDRSGNTWIGSSGDGLQKLPFPHKKFKWYRSDSSNNNVFSIYADSANVYIGSLGHGIDVFERDKGFLKNVPVNKQVRSIVNNAYTITPYGKNKILVIAHNENSNRNNIPVIYTTTSGKIEPLNSEVQKVFATCWGRGNLRHFIFADTDGTYLTNIGEHLVRLTACKENSFCPQLVNQFPGETLSNCFRDSDETLWLGTYSGIYHQTKKGWRKLTLPKNVEIKTINQDPAGNIWLGTPNEIYVLNRSGKLIQTHTEDNGLVNGHLYGILRDNDGNMWFSHNKGLSVYRWKEKKFDHYGKEDGLQSSEFNAGAYFKAADGELFFGGINGVTSFYPREIQRNQNAPAVNITGIKLFDEPYQTDIAYWNIHKLELPYTDNSISFEFAMPEYTNQAKNTYQFVMEGVDDKWINAGDRRFTRYAGLRPGHYTFKVKGANNDGVWGKETSIAITIVPPFWQRTWFIVLMILVFILLSIGVGIMIQKYRHKKVIRALEVQHKIQLERERISRDLHDNVGTQLSLISKNIEGVMDPLQNVSDAERIRNLGSISQTSKEVIFTLRETIWALNKEEITLEELSDKLKGFTQKLFEINTPCSLLFSEDIADDAVVLSPSEAIHLFRICQEAITNSLKYANAPIMKISISSVDNRYRIVIADDGIGFAKDIKKESAHYGLENMKYRAGEINCDFNIDSTPGEGTRITISKK